MKPTIQYESNDCKDNQLLYAKRGVRKCKGCYFEDKACPEYESESVNLCSHLEDIVSKNIIFVKAGGLSNSDILFGDENNMGTFFFREGRWDDNDEFQTNEVIVINPDEFDDVELDDIVEDRVSDETLRLESEKKAKLAIEKKKIEDAALAQAREEENIRRRNLVHDRASARSLRGWSGNDFHYFYKIEYKKEFG